MNRTALENFKSLNGKENFSQAVGVARMRAAITTGGRGPMALYLVRHGQTDWNRERRFQSTTDIPLNETGRAQARAIRRELARRRLRFTLARCSPLLRARDTAQIILEGTPTPWAADARFTELSLGDFEGRLEADLRRAHGRAYERWRNALFTLAAPNGESLGDAARRVAPALLPLQAAAEQGDALVVAHQGINMAIKVALCGRADVQSVLAFRQANDEVDIWDMRRGEQVERFSV